MFSFLQRSFQRFFSPHLRLARHLLKVTQRVTNYHRDLWSEQEYQELCAKKEALSLAIHQEQMEALPSLQEAQEALEASLIRLIPETKHNLWSENIEAIVVALVVAISFQAYFFKPFKIPTGSMQPTLFGMIGYPNVAQPNSALKRTTDFLLAGKSYLDLKAPQALTILGLSEKTTWNLFTTTTLKTTTGPLKLFAPKDVVERDFQILPGRHYSQGETIAQGYVQAGDQIFVDRWSYAFSKPKAADVFVFITHGIAGIEENLPPNAPSEFYIKRLAGTPGTTLRIDPPKLYLNGNEAWQAAFRRVIAAQNGYRGYSNASEQGFFGIYLNNPEATFRVPSNSYFALGDNSLNSSDSRYWGVVPAENVIGKGAFIYWPLSKRWGKID